MTTEYKNIADMQREVTGYLMIDLTPHVLSIELDGMLNSAFEPPNPGLYLPGSFQPLFRAENKYFLADSAKARPLKVDIDDIVADVALKTPLPPGDFYNVRDRKFYLDRMKYQRMRPMLKTQPTLHVRGYEAAVAVVVAYLNKLNRFTNVPVHLYELDLIVKPEGHRLIANESYENAFNDLLISVSRFVGKQTWCWYYYKVMGTTLVIERGIDYRIMQFHLKELEQTEGFDQTYGEVVDAYALARGRGR